MANPDHVDTVKRGAAAIAEWRREQPWECLDLRGADLKGVDLRQADLGGADLSGADLTGADLYLADLFRAVLIETNLTNADLGQTDLAWASVIRANLQGVNLLQATCGQTSFSDCDLSHAAGLELVHHDYPSSISVDTLVRTLEGMGGHFAVDHRVFFEEAGVPRTLVDYLPSLLESQPIQFFSCFISYGGEDAAFADRLHRQLRTRGMRCWKYDVDAIVGREVWANISRAIVLHEKMIVICSESSLERPAIHGEIERALQKEEQLKREKVARGDTEMDTDVLVPIRLDNYVLQEWDHPRAADVRKKHIGDFCDWGNDAKYEQAFGQLLRALDPRSKLGLSKADLRELGQG